jgi:hypothetical protein
MQSPSLIHAKEVLPKLTSNRSEYYCISRDTAENKPHQCGIHRWVGISGHTRCLSPAALPCESNVPHIGLTRINSMTNALRITSANISTAPTTATMTLQSSHPNTSIIASTRFVRLSSVIAILPSQHSTGCLAIINPGRTLEFSMNVEISRRSMSGQGRMDRIGRMVLSYFFQRLGLWSRT